MSTNTRSSLKDVVLALLMVVATLNTCVAGYLLYQQQHRLKIGHIKQPDYLKALQDFEREAEKFVKSLTKELNDELKLLKSSPLSKQLAAAKKKAKAKPTQENQQTYIEYAKLFNQELQSVSLGYESKIRDYVKNLSNKQRKAFEAARKEGNYDLIYVAPEGSAGKKGDVTEAWKDALNTDYSDSSETSLQPKPARFTTKDETSSNNKPQASKETNNLQPTPKAEPNKG